MLNRTLLLLPVLCVVLSTGCIVGEVGDASSSSSAPVLTAKPLSAGVHLTWTDTSKDEIHFMVMRGEHAHEGHGAEQTHEVEHEEIAELPPQTNQFHDDSTESGASYVYVVSVMTDSDETESNEVTVVAR